MAHQHDHGPHAGHHHHDHDHDHSHVPAVTGENERKILISFFIILAFMLVEAIGGLLSGSLALLADAGHMLTDAIALRLAYAAFRLGRRAADSRRSFGYARFEVIAGLINALTLFGIVGFILYEAIQRFREPQWFQSNAERIAGLVLGMARVLPAANLAEARPMPRLGVPAETFGALDTALSWLIDDILAPNGIQIRANHLAISTG